jgi:hypothetical protein
VDWIRLTSDIIQWRTLVNTIINKVRFKVLTVACMKMVFFWVVAPCSLVEVYRRFRGVCCHKGGVEDRFFARGLHITLMMEAASTYETSVNFYQTTPCNNTEDSCTIINLWIP